MDCEFVMIEEGLNASTDSDLRRKYLSALDAGKLWGGEMEV